MIPQLLNWNILSKPRTDFEHIDHKIRKKYFFISGIWSSKAFAKYSFADFEILAIPKKKILGSNTFDTSYSTTFFLKSPIWA